MTTFEVGDIVRFADHYILKDKEQWEGRVVELGKRYVHVCWFKRSIPGQGESHEHYKDLRLVDPLQDLIRQIDRDLETY